MADRYAPPASVRRYLGCESAAKAGLKGQDVLVQFDGRPIRNLEDFTYMLRTHKPRDMVGVVLRDGKPTTVKVALEVRR